MLASLNLPTFGVGLHYAQPKKVSLSRALSYDICHMTKEHRLNDRVVRVCECTRDRLLAESKHHNRREVVDTRAFAAAFGFVVGAPGRKLEAARGVPACQHRVRVRDEIVEVSVLATATTGVTSQVATVGIFDHLVRHGIGDALHKRRVEKTRIRGGEVG